MHRSITSDITRRKNAEIEAAKQIENAKNDLEYLESTLAAIETSDTESDLNAIRAELIAEGYLNRKFNPKKQNKMRQNLCTL